MNIDGVVIGSFLTVVLAVVIVVFLGFKVKKLVEKDAESHRE